MSKVTKWHTKKEQKMQFTCFQQVLFLVSAPKCAMDMMMLNMDHGCKYDGPSLQENPYICVYGMNQDLGGYESVVCLQIVVGFCYNKQIWAALVG